MSSVATKTQERSARLGRRERARTVRRRPRLTRSPAFVVQQDRTTHVLVPIEEYEELIKSAMVERALGEIGAENVQWVDADEFALELAGERIAKARKDRGLTQKQLGEKLGLPQSQVSRIERNPDRTTVRTLKRIARALGVDVSALV